MRGNFAGFGLCSRLELSIARWYCSYKELALG
jgi:hypothetical protein